MYFLSFTQLSKLLHNDAGNVADILDIYDASIFGMVKCEFLD
jgi:hypothetical protein